MTIIALGSQPLGPTGDNTQQASPFPLPPPDSLSGSVTGPPASRPVASYMPTSTCVPVGCARMVLYVYANGNAGPLELAGKISYRMTRVRGPGCVWTLARESWDVRER